MEFKSIKTVVVDDENIIRRGIERLITSCGEQWEIIGSFRNGKELIDHCLEQKIEFELLITDIKMPEMDGLTLIKELKKMFSFSAIVISGYDDFSYLQTAVREGAIDYLLKPIDRDEFKVQLQNAYETIQRERIKQQQFNEMKMSTYQATHTKQIQQLSKATFLHYLDLSQMEWTKDFPTGTFLLISGSIDMHVSKSNTTLILETDNYLLTIKNIIENVSVKYSVEHNLKLWCWEGEKGSFWLLISKDKGEMSSFKGTGLANLLKITIKKSTAYTASFAISSNFDDLSLIPTIKEELQRILQFRLIYGGNRIYGLDLVGADHETSQLVHKKVEQAIQQLMFTLDKRDCSEIKSKIDILFEEFKKIKTPYEIEQSVYSLAIQTAYYLIKHKRASIDIQGINEIMLLSKKMANMHNLKVELTNWLLNIVESLTVTENDPQVDRIQVAKKWIEGHLEQKITIEKIAQQVFMNPTYFCELFKNETGETVLDYVTRVRLYKAKELLLNTDDKIYEVIEKVGYVDKKHFNKLFKKFFGDSPSLFREKTK